MSTIPDLPKRLATFCSLGRIFAAVTQPESVLPPGSQEKRCVEILSNAMAKASIANPWFTRENIQFALEAWATELTADKLLHWSQLYEDELTKSRSGLVAVIMAGNIPLVGMHDFISVLLCGKRFLGKLSKDDNLLLPAVAEVICLLEPAFREMIRFTESSIQDFDAVIATGSNNTARYFEYYFSNKPHIIRKNRNGAAILRGNENNYELELLATDMFTYFGLGCRNVSKIFLPAAFDPGRILDACSRYRNQLSDHFRYMNNYAYQKTILQMNMVPFFDNGFLILREQPAYPSPVSVVHYEYYKDEEQLSGKITGDSHLIQCLVADKPGLGYIPFGSTQHPRLWDYADGVDTVQFILSI